MSDSHLKALHVIWKSTLNFSCLVGAFAYGIAINNEGRTIITPQVSRDSDDRQIWQKKTLQNDQQYFTLENDNKYFSYYGIYAIGPTHKYLEGKIYILYYWVPKNWVKRLNIFSCSLFK